jgi:hypothetical protein
MLQSKGWDVVKRHQVEWVGAMLGGVLGRCGLAQNSRSDGASPVSRPTSERLVNRLLPFALAAYSGGLHRAARVVRERSSGSARAALAIRMRSRARSDDKPLVGSVWRASGCFSGPVYAS